MFAEADGIGKVTNVDGSLFMYALPEPKFDIAKARVVPAGITYWVLLSPEITEGDAVIRTKLVVVDIAETAAADWPVDSIFAGKKIFVNNNPPPKATTTIANKASDFLINATIRLIK